MATSVNIMILMVYATIGMHCRTYNMVMSEHADEDDIAKNIILSMIMPLQLLLEF